MRKDAKRTPIIVAVIGFLLVLATGLFVNWDKIFKQRQSYSDQRPNAMDEFQPVPTENPKMVKSPELTGQVIDSDTNTPLAAVTIDLYSDLGHGRYTPLWTGAATTGPDGIFKVSLQGIEESDFPLMMELQHRNWMAAIITSTKIEFGKEYSELKILIAMSDVRPR